jgi:hypothetical protein
LVAGAQNSKRKAQPRATAPSTLPAYSIAVEISHLIFMPVRVNGSEPQRFILDSASTFSLIDSSVAENLGLKTDGQRRLRGVGENAFDVRFAHDVPLEVSGVRLMIKDLAVTPLTNKLYKGLIGADLFEQFVVEVDYDRRVVSLFEPDQFRYSGRGEIVPLKLRDNIPVIASSVATGSDPPVNARLDVDTGAAQTLVFTRPFVESNRLLESTAGMLRMAAGGLGGRTLYLLGRVKTFNLGRFRFADCIAGFSQDQKGAGAATDRDGVVGNGVLKRFKVIFDYSRNRLILEPAELLDVPFDYDWCGLNIVVDGKDFRIDRVGPGTHADDAGFKAGDIILAVDGKAASEFKLNQLRGLFTQNGHEYLLSIRRNDQIIQLKLQSIKML